MFFQKKGLSELIAELSELMRKHALGEIEYERNGARIRVAQIPSAQAAASAPAAAPVAREHAAPAAAPAPENMANAVKSPMVGVVYMSPEPGAKHFVAEGQQVKAGDVLCLIEAMKTFNQVKSDRAGVVKKILVSHNESVEFGQPLFVVE